MPTPTTPANLAKINKAYMDLSPLMTNLYSRWLDEGGFEDIEEYGKVIKKNLPKGFKLTQMTKRPFGFHFTIGTDAIYAITMKSKQYAWTRVK